METEKDRISRKGHLTQEEQIWLLERVDLKSHTPIGIFLTSRDAYYQVKIEKIRTALCLLGDNQSNDFSAYALLRIDGYPYTKDKPFRNLAAPGTGDKGLKVFLNKQSRMWLFKETNVEPDKGIEREAMVSSIVKIRVIAQSKSGLSLQGSFF